MDAEQDAHFQLMKRLLVIIPLSTILILSTLCVILGVSLYDARRQLRELRERNVPAIAQSEPVKEGEQSGAVYTASGVSESKRGTFDAENAAGEGDGGRKVYLTFDDGPSSNTGEILDILAAYDVKATFFVVGKTEEKYQPLYKRIVEEGHTLAMHSYSHKYNEIYQSRESYVEDLTKLQEFLYETTGVWCRYCRFPGGSSNTVSRVDMHELIEYLEEQDMTYFDWNVSSGDASTAYISPEAVVRNSTARLSEFQEAIILLHDASDKDSTVQALPELIEKIQAMEDTTIVPITDETEPIHHISNE
ncbi:MAG: polysaccharide deacetylase [Bacteroidales bacterium]|nr:polysaccharide deacetylase [Bacteroidales bacterium]MCM1415593.1 polysaccharide deacetylase [bacterium]MCM1422986.1 polysaccharide deacetylase [bacterium]